MAKLFAVSRMRFDRRLAMMKRLLILAAVAILTTSMLGCQCRNWFRRGSLFSTTTPPAVTCYDPCDPVDQCDPCQGTAGPEFGGMNAPVLPGPGI